MCLTRPILVVVLAAIAACDDPSGPDSRYPGYIRLADLMGPEVSIAQDGTAVEVVVTTYGLDGCHQNAGEDVVVDDRTLTIRPFDRVDHDDGQVCPDEIVWLEHDVVIEDAEIGVWTVRVLGDTYDGGVTVADSVVMQFEVTAQPAPE